MGQQEGLRCSDDVKNMAGHSDFGVSVIEFCEFCKKRWPSDNPDEFKCQTEEWSVMGNFLML